MKLVDSIRAIPSRSDRGYARCKIATDPLYPAVAQALSAAPVADQPLLDIGCGMGLLAFFLLDRGWSNSIHGLDYDPRKVCSGAEAIRVLAIDQVELSTGDARTDLPTHAGHVTILDILQFMPRDEQQRLLEDAASRVAPGGRLVIRSGLDAPGWRFRVTETMDRLARLLRWMKESPRCYPTEAFFRETLSAVGLEVECSPLWGKTPFHNYLIVGTRPLES